MKAIFFAIAGLAGAASAQASIIPTFVGSPFDVGGGSFRYDYSATLASDQALVTGSYFTLYDVVGFTGFGTLGAGFAGSSQLVGVTPSNVLPNDDPNLINVTFTYSGPTINFDEPLSERDLGIFQIFSTIGEFGFDDFTSQAIRNSGRARGSLVATIGTEAIPIPGGGGGTGADVPEPTIWAMLIAGFGMVGVSMRRRVTRVRAIAA